MPTSRHRTQKAVTSHTHSKCYPEPRLTFISQKNQKSVAVKFNIQYKKQFFSIQCLIESNSLDHRILKRAGGLSMHQLLRLIFLALISFTALIAEELPEEPRQERGLAGGVDAPAEASGAMLAGPLAHLEGEPSSIVNGVVNAITGVYSESTIDIHLPGAEPLVIERSYNHLDQTPKYLFYGWNINHSGEINIEDSHKAVFKEGSGCQLQYEQINKHQNPRLFAVSKEKIRKGFTNCGYGEIGGGSNIKNNKIIYDPDKHTCSTISGSGTITEYIIKKDPGTLKKKYRNKNFLLHREKKLNGNQIVSDYYETTLLTTIRSVNSQGLGLCGVTFHYDLEKVEICTSEDKKITYLFKLRKEKEKKRLYLTEVVRPDAPKETYIYDESIKDLHIPLIRKEKPNGRCLEIEYYNHDHKHNEVGEDIVKIKHSHDPRINRVKLLRAPVGSDATPLITHRFFYNANKKMNGGITSVHDALNHRVDYTCSEDERLTEITKFSGTHNNTHQLYSREKLFWGYNKSDLGGSDVHQP